MPDTTHKLKCPDCETEFTVTKTAEQFEAPEDETVCPECGESFLAMIDEATGELILEPNDEEDEDDEDTDFDDDDDDDDEDEE